MKKLIKTELIENYLKEKNSNKSRFCKECKINKTNFRIIDKFGLYADTAKAWHNFGTNLFVLYVLFVFAVVIFASIKTKTSSIKTGRYISLSFLTLYVAVVKITGEFAYSIRWFPYIIFDATSYGNALGISSYPVCVLLTILTFVLLAVAYALLFTAFARLKEKQ